MFWQIQNKYDKLHGDPKMWSRFGKKKPVDWESLQIKDAREVSPFLMRAWAVM